MGLSMNSLLQGGKPGGGAGTGLGKSGKKSAPLTFRICLSYNSRGQIPVRHKEAAVKILKLPKEKLDLFASVVQQFGELHAPVEQDGKYAFKRLTRWSDARLDYDRTILPPKKYYLPPRETQIGRADARRRAHT